MCKSVDPRYKEICSKLNSKAYCAYCEGTSSLSRVKEEKYLILAAQEHGVTLPEPTPLEKLPPILTQTKNFIKSLLNHVAGGAKMVDDAEFDRRMNICKGCDRLQNDRCLECGCFVEVKARWSSEECPLKKWVSQEQKSRGSCCG